MKPLVAIVGRPNVGKSTLFNRLAGRRLAIVEDVPGVTRDRQYADASWDGRPFMVIDTGGFVPGEHDALLSLVREQAQLAIDEAELTLLVVDGREGPTAADEEVARALRKSGKPVLLVVNKVDDEKLRDSLTADFHRMGLGDVLGVSAEHSLGIDALRDAIAQKLPPPSPEELAREEQELQKARGELPEGELPEVPADAPVRVAIIGRPNVGKSTLVNALLKQKRFIASEVPGTTRDAIDTELTYQGRRFILTDTAGIRRKRSIAQKVESFAVVASLRAIDRSEVVVVLLDATEPAVDQDARLAAIAEEKGRALIVVVNKWDQLEKQGGKAQERLRDELKLRFKFVSHAPVVFTSALTGQKVEKVLQLAGQLFDQYHFRAPTPRLNKLLDHMKENHPAPIVGGKPLRLYYIAQVGTAPPAFAIITNAPSQVPDSFRRYLVNQLRDTFDIKVPIRIFFRERPGQAKRRARKRPQRRR